MPPDPLEHSLTSAQMRRAPEADQRNSAIGPYEVLDLLGSGSFGIVYRVTRVPGETLALKLLITTDAEDTLRFEREIELARRLEHPGLVPIVDAGRQAQFPYYVMEYCPGETLTQRLKRGPLDPDDAIQLVLDLARTTAEINAGGVVHRDLKPSNVIVGPNGRPRITDFGLAHDARAAERLTRTGDRMGTPAYMAPELFEDAKRADQRVDVYALGVILYECLTGARPFQADDLAEVARRVRSGRCPSPRSLRPELHPQLEAICLRAMSRRPEDRPTTADMLADELEQFLAAPQAGATEPALRRALVGVSLLAAAILVAIGVLLARSAPPASETAEATDAPAPSASAAPSPSPVGATPEPAPKPDLSTGHTALKRARAADLARAAAGEVLPLYATAREQARGDRDLEQAAIEGELSILFTRGHVTELLARSRAVERDQPHLARRARWYRVRVLPRQAPERIDLLRQLANTGQDGFGILARALLAGARDQPLDPKLLELALRLDPTLTQARVYLAAVALRAKRLSDGLRLATEALEHAPNDPEAHWSMITALQTARRSKDAIPYLDRLLQLRHPQAADRHAALYQRARMSLHLRRFQEGIPFLDQALEVKPGDPVTLILRGFLRLSLRDPTRAGADFRGAALRSGYRRFQAALDRRYRNPQTQSAIWRAALSALRPPATITPSPEALARAKRRAADTPDSVRARVTQLLIAAGRGAPWSELGPGWKAVLTEQPNDPATVLLYLDALIGRDHASEIPQGAIHAHSLVKTLPQRRALLRLVAEAARRLQQLPKAKQAWQRLIRLDPRGPDGARARALLALPEKVGVLEGLERAAKASPRHIPTLASLVVARTLAGDPLHAIALTDRLQQQGEVTVTLVTARLQALTPFLKHYRLWPWLREDAERALRIAPFSAALRTVVRWALESSPVPEHRAWLSKVAPVEPRRD